MDFLDSIDSKFKDNKARRVRSWYLYEQYKSLERNQLDAAQKLRDKSCQDKILRQELHERRVRRNLYDQSDQSCNSDIHINKTLSEEKSLCSSSDDFFESFCELQDDKSSRGSDNVSDTDETYSQDDSRRCQKYLHKFKSLDKIGDDESYAESVNSVIDNYKSSEDLAADIQDKLSLVEKNITEEINHQLEIVKENIECLEKYTKICNDDRISECESLVSIVEHELKKISASHKGRESDITLYNVWSKLVSFAYQVIQLNHGNCYYDYGSQFLTAVLACDVLRRGVCRMCHILQPYVSPIKYTTDESDNSMATNKCKRKLTSKKSRNSKVQSSNQRKLPKITRLSRRHYSEDYWGKLSKYTQGYKNKRQYINSEPCRSINKLSTYHSGQNEKAEVLLESSLWPSFSRDSSGFVDCKCSCHSKITNPMLKLGQYIDRLINNIDDCRPE